MAEKTLAYDRSIVPQETDRTCGPASIQVVLSGRGIAKRELDLERETEALENPSGRNDYDGTDHIGQIRTVLNRHVPAARYVVVELPKDPPTLDQRNKLWAHIVSSIDAGYGVVTNIVSPPSNRPTAVWPSTVSPNYGRSKVFHYFTVMGYRDDKGVRKVWIADSGFSPYGFWITLDQLATLIAPKGYTYATAKPSAPTAPAVDAAVDLRAQLTGSTELGKYPGWAQLGGRTVTDAVAAILAKLGVK